MHLLGLLTVNVVQALGLAQLVNLHSRSNNTMQCLGREALVLQRTSMSMSFKVIRLMSEIEHLNYLAAYDSSNHLHEAHRSITNLLAQPSSAFRYASKIFTPALSRIPTSLANWWFGGLPLASSCFSYSRMAMNAAPPCGIVTLAYHRPSNGCNTSRLVCQMELPKNSTYYRLHQ